MPLPKQYHTSKDYWNLPEGQRAELIDGTLYDMAPPSYRHQFLIAKLSFVIQEYIFSHAGNCQLLMAPFAVNLDADDKNWVEPDISVICDRNKLHDHGCFGAPDWIIEIVSPSSRRMYYSTKNTLYSEAGVLDRGSREGTYYRIPLRRRRRSDHLPVPQPGQRRIVSGFGDPYQQPSERHVAA